MCVGFDVFLVSYQLFSVTQEKMLFQAAREGRRKELISLLDQGVHIQCKDQVDQVHLHHIAEVISLRSLSALRLPVNNDVGWIYRPTLVR